jgi:DNA-binding IclR family transcriptional regulator
MAIDVRYVDMLRALHHLTQQSRGIPPTAAELASYLHVHFNTVYTRLRRLEAGGFVMRTMAHRSMRLTGPGLAQVAAAARAG